MAVSPTTLLAMMKLIELLIVAVEAVVDLGSDIRLKTAAVRKMVEEKRDPTPEEWAAILAEGDALTDRLRSILMEKTGGVPE